jgi:hypothetical protein
MQIPRFPFRRVALRLLVLLGLTLSATEAVAQKLTIQGDRFAVDGVPKFLTFMSYFGAMGAPNIIADLRALKSLGFDGIRIWPNLDTGPQLMNSDGSLRPDELTRLLSILNQARIERLVVDVTFTHEHIKGMGPAATRAGILAAVGVLRSYDNVLIDIQNERNVGDGRFMSEADVASIFAGIRAIDPARITTASNSPADDADYAADFTARLGLDVTAYHEPRNSRWYEAAEVQNVVGRMKVNGKPAYMQESMSTRDELYFYPAHDRADYFMQSIANAKMAGAAAWCFHTDAGVDFRHSLPFVEDVLRSYPEPDWNFVTSLIPRVALKTSDGTHYVVAEGGGGGGVVADRTAAGPGSWEIVSVVSVSGGPLVSGDRVVLRTADGTHYLQAAAGGGGALRAVGESIGAWETFIIERAGGGLIRHGDAVSLRVNNTSWYVGAAGGGGGSVSVNNSSRGSWETFTILFISPHL